MAERENDGPILSDFATDPDMAEIVELFVGELPDRVSSLYDAWRAGAAEDLQRLAHQLKGASGGYGFSVIGEAAAELEAALKRDEGDLCRLQDEFDRLVALCNRATFG